MDIKNIKARIKTIDKRIIYGASVAVALAVLASGYAFIGKENSYASVPKKEEPVSVETVIVEPKIMDATVSAAGALNSRNTSVLSSKVMGKVVELTVHEGDYVSPGTSLMRIESGEITAQVYQAQAAYNNAKLQFERIKSLFSQNAATQMEMDQATLGFESAKAGLNAAKAMESYTMITAPIAGRIVEKKINVGEMALPGQPVLRIEDNGSLRLEVTVKEQDIRFVGTGKPVTVRIDALPGKELKARVAQVIPAADPRTHSFVVKVDVPADRGLITGMYGKALFSIGKRNAILVPRSSIVEMSGVSGVYVVSSEGNAVFQMVQPGEEQGGMIEAVTGLKAGDRVIVAGQVSGMDGRKVVVAQN